jgi:hypothetical protein
MNDDTAKRPTTDLLAAMRAETPNDETKGTEAPSTDAANDDAVETKVNEPTLRRNPRA